MLLKAETASVVQAIIKVRMTANTATLVIKILPFAIFRPKLLRHRKPNVAFTELNPKPWNNLFQKTEHLRQQERISSHNF